MNAKHIYNIDKLPAGKTDWKKVSALSDEEINKAAKTDSAAKPLSKKKLSLFKRVPSQ